MAPIPPKRFRACYFPVTPLIRENYLPDQPNSLPVRLLFGAQALFLVNYLKTNRFRQIVAAKEAPRQAKKGANREEQGEEAEIGA
jgi:hypothetical protein